MLVNHYKEVEYNTKVWITAGTITYVITALFAFYSYHKLEEQFSATKNQLASFQLKEQNVVLDGDSNND
jgi:hypothetical protein